MIDKINAECVVQLVVGALTDKTPIIPQNADLQAVFECAKAREVANICYFGLLKVSGISADTVLKWENYAKLSIKRKAEQERIIREVTGLFESAGIRSMQAQGSVVDDFYPQPYYRMMSDIDFIVDEQNLNKAKDVLTENDFEFKEGNEYEFSAEKSGCLVEVHSEFFPPARTFLNGIKCLSAMDKPFTRQSETNGLTYRLSQGDLYLFNLLHTVKHFLSDGAGLRRIIDLYVLQEKLGQEIDFDHVEEVLKRCKIYAPASALINLAKVWFCGEKKGKNYDRAFEEVFMSGNHGSRDIVVKRKAEARKRKGKGKKGYLKSRFFIGKDLCYKIYPFCAKHKLPLWLCYMHRFNVYLFNPKKRKAIKEELKKYDDYK